MKKYFIFLFLLQIIMTLFSCKVENKSSIQIEKKEQNFFEKNCLYPINIFLNFEEFHKRNVDGKKDTIWFNKSERYKYYIFNDTIKIKLKHKNYGMFVYVNGYNIFHDQKVFFTYIHQNKYGLWLGIEDSLDNVDEFNEAMSIFDIAIKDSQQAINYALFYLRISDNGNLTRFYLRSIEDIWLLTQYYFLYLDKYNLPWHISEIQKFDGGYLHANLTRDNKYVVKQPEEFPDYDIIYPKYRDVIHPPQAQYISGNFIVEMYVWSRINGFLKKWELEITPKGKIITANQRIVDKYIGHYFKGINLIFFEKEQ